MAKRKAKGATAQPIKTADAIRTGDSFANFISNVGRATGNQHDGAHYSFNPVSRNRLEMEWAYRGSWIIGRAVDCVAKDMTREGVTINTTMAPSDISRLDKSLDGLTVWSQLCDTVKWSRLYGGALGFLMIDGQDPSTPLIPERLGKGQFKGVLPMDRWLLNPSLQDLVGDFGPDFGLPRFYQTVPDSMGMPLMLIHHSRVIRLGGVKLPYWQRIAENLWGQSILERMWDRLLAFDSTTTGVAQMAYKAHLRTVSIEQLREIISIGGDAMQGVIQQIAMMRLMQTNEDITLLDAKDKFETHQYAFGGLDAILTQFSEQLAGATDIPLVKLFGQSPSGFSTGESDLRSYNDNVKQAQVSELGPGVEKLYKVAAISALGTAPPEEFSIEWKPLQQMTDEEKGSLAEATARAIGGMYEQQIIKRSTALKELKQSSKITGTFTNIEDDEIAEAENDPAPSPEALGLTTPPKPEGGLALGKGGEGGKSGGKDHALRIGDSGLDAETQDDFVEAKHPRDENGRFAKGTRHVVNRPGHVRHGERGEIVGHGPSGEEPRTHELKFGNKPNGIFKESELEKAVRTRMALAPAATALEHANKAGAHGQQLSRAAHSNTNELETSIFGYANAAKHEKAAALHESAAAYHTEHGSSEAAAAHAQAASIHRKMIQELAPKPKKPVGDSMWSRIWRAVIGDKYDPNEPRDPDGKWTTAGGGHSMNKKNQWVTAQGKPVSKEHAARIKALKIPPAYLNVQLNPDKNGRLQAVATSPKTNKRQYFYTAGHKEDASAEKFDRIKSFNKIVPKVRAIAYRDLADSKKSPRERDMAAVTAIISETGFRIGSDADTGAEKKAFGASNLRAAHVKVNGNKITFSFTGKKGVHQTHHIVSEPLAKYLAKRKEEIGKGRLFDVKEHHVRGYVKATSGDDFQVKDFRTWVGTATALQAVKSMPVPKNEKQLKEARKKVAEIVSKKLGNTPTVALRDYIAPEVFAPWETLK